MSQQQMMINAALQTWESNVKRTNELINNLSDEQMMAEIAPGKNRAVYLLGHLAAVHDRIVPLLGLGERQYPHLDEAFVTNPDKTVAELPSIAELKTAWTTSNEILSKKFAAMPEEEWLGRHTAISEEDFAKEPHRNKFSVLMSRNNHLSYHLGQLILAKK